MNNDHIPLHEFSYQREHPVPFMIGRFDQLPPAAQAGYPNRHTFSEIFWIAGGAGSHVIDFIAHPIQPHTLYFIAPGQIHFWQLVSPLAGFAMLLPPEFFRAGFMSQSLLDELTLFRPEATTSALTLAGADAEAIDRLVHELAVEYASRQFGQVAALQALVELLLIRAQRLLLAGAPPVRLGAAAELTRRFLRLVEERFTETHMVASYAATLGVTAGHLTDTARASVGRSAGAVIRDRLILEAKRLLAHSDVPIVAVAHRLCFADASYFGRVFRRATGQTPQAFRAEFRKMYQDSRDLSLA